jgi:hypothetical protein
MGAAPRAAPIASLREVGANQWPKEATSVVTL